MIITGKNLGLAVIWILCLSVLLAGCGGLTEQASEPEVELNETNHSISCHLKHPENNPADYVEEQYYPPEENIFDYE